MFVVVFTFQFVIKFCFVNDEYVIDPQVLQSLNGGFDWAHHDSEASMTGQDLMDLDCSAADSCYAASVTQLQTSELLVYKAK